MHKKKAGKLQTGSTFPKQYWLAVNGKPKRIDWQWHTWSNRRQCHTSSTYIGWARPWHTRSTNRWRSSKWHHSVYPILGAPLCKLKERESTLYWQGKLHKPNTRGGHSVLLTQVTPKKLLCDVTMYIVQPFQGRTRSTEIALFKKFFFRKE